MLNDKEFSSPLRDKTDLEPGLDLLEKNALKAILP
jgi:hypothetical protein